MTISLSQMRSDNTLQPEHVALGLLMQRVDTRDDTRVGLAAALVSDQLSRGHVCLDLDAIPTLVFTVGGDNEKPMIYDRWPLTAQWLESLGSSPVVHIRTSDDTAESIERPLVLDADRRRLYLAKYWFYQQKLAQNLAARIGMKPLALDEQRLASDIDALFPDRRQPGGRDQCLAAANAVDQRFCVITGGPGTGKTTTVAKLLALRLLNDPRSQNLRVAVSAPTGKAAQRLNESMGRVIDQQLAEVSETIRGKLRSIKAFTVHRLLSWTPAAPEKGGPFLHRGDLPLDADVVLVDEASMLDLGLMYRLMDAVRPEAQVILMGDRDQLASVEAGGVLADLCGGAAAGDGGMSGARRELLHTRTGLTVEGRTANTPNRLGDHVVTLGYSHRFDPKGDLGKLALLVREGNTNEFLKALRNPQSDSIQWIHDGSVSKCVEKVLDIAVTEYSHYRQTLEANQTGSIEVIRQLGRFRVLCAHRSGPLGESTLNRRVGERLNPEEADRSGGQPFYLGCPIMIRSNNYREQLFNGDVGVLVRAPDGESLEGLFEDAGQPGGLRRLGASLLPTWRPCYATTIHKSQGSEYHRVIAVLPPRPSPILTRELLYTAITRVADEMDPVSGQRRAGRLCLVGSEEVLRTAVDTRIRRTSGLRDALQC